MEAITGGHEPIDASRFKLSVALLDDIISWHRGSLSLRRYDLLNRFIITSTGNAGGMGGRGLKRIGEVDIQVHGHVEPLAKSISRVHPMRKLKWYRDGGLVGNLHCHERVHIYYSKSKMGVGQRTAF